MPPFARHASAAILACVALAPACGGSDFTPAANDGGTPGADASAGGSAGQGGAAGGQAGAAGKAGGGGTAQGGQAGGGGSATCPSSKADCDGNEANGCETDVLTSGGHCGACKHSCLGAPCVGGACQAVDLAIDAKEPLGLAVMGTDVFWVDTKPSALRRVGKEGAGGYTYGYTFVRPNGIVADKDANRIYVADFSGNAVVSCDAIGTECTKLAEVPSPAFVTFNATHLFVTAWGDGTVRRIDKLSHEVVTLADNQGNPQGIGMGSASVFWTNGATEIRKKLADNTGEIAGVNGAPLPKPTNLRLDGTDVFYTGAGDGGVGTGEVGRCLKAGGSCVALASAQGMPWDLSVDAKNVYWTNYGTGQVMRVERDNPGTPVVMWVAASSKPWGIDMDAESIYWSCQGTGKIMKLAK
jgi:hypothetical protein